MIKFRSDGWAKALSAVNFATVRRTAAWASATFIALVAFIITAESETGLRRLRNALSNQQEPAVVVAQIPQTHPDVDRLNQRLADTVRQMASERDRLNERIAVLERNFDDMTGSIKKSVESAAAPPSPPAAQVLAPPPMPVFSVLSLLPADSPAAWPAPESPPPKLSPVESQPVPLPPVRITRHATVAPEPEPAADRQDLDGDSQNAGQSVGQSVGLGIDLGGARSIDALTIHWSSMKLKFGAILNNLQPVVAIRERKPGVPELRLIAGPMQSPQDATQACMTIVAARLPCRPTTFAGQRLNLR